jgi:8-oxo-dGTP diphosphatase
MKRDYPDRPILGVGAVILNGERFVLVQRGSEPHKNEWSVPGGMLESGESLRDAVVREAREETSLEVEPVALVEVFERVIRDDCGEIRFHYVILDYLCRSQAGTLSAGADALDARWLRLDDLSSLSIADGTLGVLKKALAAAKKH